MRYFTFSHRTAGRGMQTIATRTLAAIIAVSIGISSCTTLIPRHTASTTPDVNGVLTYWQPSYERQVTWAGVLGVGFLGIAGAAGGYYSDLSLRWYGWDRPESVRPWGNAALGGISGLVTGLLVTLIANGEAPPVTSENAADWLQRLDEKLIVITSESTGSTSGRLQQITAIPRNGDASFTIRSLDDARLFARMFPDSPQADSVVSRAASHLDRAKLPELAAIFPDVPASEQAIARFIRESRSFDSTLMLAVTYPQHRETATHRAAELVGSVEEAQRFDTTFPGSSEIEEITSRLASMLDRDDVPGFVSMFPQSSAVPALKRMYVDSSRTTAEAIEAGERFRELGDVARNRAAALATSVGDYRAYLATWPSDNRAPEMVARMNDVLSRPEVLGEGVNTLYAEIGPVISPDGRMLFFSRRFSPDNTGGSSDPDEIWVSVMQSDGQWSHARQIGWPINRTGPDHMGSVTPDGNTLLLGNAYDGTQGISVTHRTTDGWSYPDKLDIDNYYSTSSYLNYYMANDGRTIVLSIRRSDSRGGNDLYVTFRQAGNSWSEPKSLGVTINTKYEESAPFLAADGQTLYFASNGQGGLGGSDIFMTRRLDNSWKRWSKPLNLGSTINSVGDDSFFFIPASGDYAYYSTDQFSPGNDDIVRIGVPESARPRAVVLVAGRVIELGTDRPLEAEIIYESLADGKVIGTARSDPRTGEFKIALPSGASYAFRAEAAGYVAVADNLDLTKLTRYEEQRRDLTLVPLEAGQSIRLNNLFFDVAKATIRPESAPELDRMTMLMRLNPSMTVEITGHTDDVGTDENNQVLSEQRAAAVRDYIVSRGIAAGRITSRGLGESHPVAPNDTDEGRQRNRRVEFAILTK